MGKPKIQLPRCCRCISPVKVLISPERKNLRISVIKCKKKNIFAKINWLVDLALPKEVNMPTTIIFCNMISEIASVANSTCVLLCPDIFQFHCACLRTEICLRELTLSRTLNPNPSFRSVDPQFSHKLLFYVH